jgi:H+/Cl- antiporter ClcA
MDELAQQIGNLLDVHVSERSAAQFGAIALGLFLFMLAAAIAILSGRLIRYRRRKQRIPLIAKRDFWFLMGLALPFLGIFFARAFGIKDLSTNLWWIIATTFCALGAVGVWLYYEVFVIERPNEGLGD